MARIDEKELKHQIKNGFVKDAYLFYGDEAYLKTHYVDALVREAVGASADFNLHTFDVQDSPVTAEDLYMAARSCPMMGGKSCVLVRDLSPDSLGERELDLIVELIEQPSPSCVLIFLFDRTEATPKKNNKWKRLFAAVEKYGTLVQLDKLSAKSLETRLVTQARRRLCALEPDAAAYLVAQAGDDLNLLLNELEKCCAYVGPGAPIRREDVEAVCVHSLDSTAFDLVRAIHARNCLRAYELLDELFVQRVEPIMIHGALAASYIDMYRARVSSEATGDPVAVAKIFPGTYRNREFRLRNAARDTRSTGTRQLRQCLDCLDEADRLLKGGGAEPRIILEETVVKLLKISGGERA